MYRLPASDIWPRAVLLLLTGVGRMGAIKHNIADALRGRGATFAPTSTREEPIDRLYRLIGGPAVWQVSPELDQLFRAKVHKDPMARPSASDILHCDWMRRGDEVTEAEVVVAFERRMPVSEEAHNTMSVTCAPRLKDTAKGRSRRAGAPRAGWPGGANRGTSSPRCTRTATG